MEGTGATIVDTRKTMPGLRVLDITSVSPAERPIQAQVLWSEYDVELGDALPRAEVTARIGRLLGQRECVIEETREGKTRLHDIRPGIAELRVSDPWERSPTLLMRLRAGQQPNVRPEQVTVALGLRRPARVNRRRLVLGAAGGLRLRQTGPLGHVSDSIKNF